MLGKIWSEMAAKKLDMYPQWGEMATNMALESRRTLGTHRKPGLEELFTFPHHTWGFRLWTAHPHYPTYPQFGPSCLSLEMLTPRRRKDPEAALTVLPEVLQLGCSQVQAVDPGQDVCHGPVPGPAPARRHRGQGHGTVDVASTVLQQEERSAKDAGEANWDVWG